MSKMIERVARAICRRFVVAERTVKPITAEELHALFYEGPADLFEGNPFVAACLDQRIDDEFNLSAEPETATVDGSLNFAVLAKWLNKRFGVK